jgi:hypothetical protein
MAVDKYGSEILHSLYGRLFGFDGRGFQVGPSGSREPQEPIAAASTLENFGTSVLTGTTAAFTLAAPLAKGINKEIVNASSISTASMAIVRSTALGACSFLPHTSGTTQASDGGQVRINLLNVGSRVVLRSISTSQWAAMSFPQSSLYYTATTSS